LFEVATMLVVSDQDLNDSAVLSRTELGPCLRGAGTAMLWCGNCGELLVEGVDPVRVVDVVFQCTCGAYNRPIVDRPHAHAVFAQPPL
jgi:hypothetical protein